MEAEVELAALGPRLTEALVAAYGPDVGVDAAADAVAWGWEHIDRLSDMTNPAGYLYRVGQSAARRYRRPQGYLPAPDRGRVPDVEPGLASALEQLTEHQRVAVVAVHCFGWSQQDVADVMGVSHSTVRSHLTRGLDKLRRALEASDDS